MPTYEYACSSCGNAWEEIQKITEPAIELCPACKKTTAKRQISGGTFILKGGGWYSDLYSSPKAGPSKDDSSKPGEAGKSESKDAKTETKSDGETKKSEPKKDSGTPSGSAGASSGSSAPSKAAAE